MAKEYVLDRDSFLNPDAQPPSAINLKYRLGREMDELLGICKGILADNVVVDAEARYLASWLQRNQEVVLVWPARELALRLGRILADGVVTPEEKDELGLFLTKMTGEPVSDRDLPTKANPSTQLPLDDPAPSIEFPQRRFCFTGKFLSGTRNWCCAEVTKRGGLAEDSPTSCDYLVVGVLGSRDWAHSAYGRKIEAAVARKKTPLSWPRIVAEEHWVFHLESTPRVGI